MSPFGVLITTGSACVAVLAIIAFVRWVWPTLRKLGHLVDDLAGEPARPGVEARPGVMERLAQIETNVSTDVNGRLDTLDRGQAEILRRQDTADHTVSDLADAIRDSQRDRMRIWDVLYAAQLSTPPDPATD